MKIAAAAAAAAPLAPCPLHCGDPAAVALCLARFRFVFLAFLLSLFLGLLRKTIELPLSERWQEMRTERERGWG